MTYEGMITELKPNEIFVFGSNTQGRHGKGAALFARQKCGAEYGNPLGRQGNSYAIVTKDLTKPYNVASIGKEYIREQILILYKYAEDNPTLRFMVAYSGTGRNLNNYSNQEMAELFWLENIPDNIIFEQQFNKLIYNGER